MILVVFDFGGCKIGTKFLVNQTLIANTKNTTANRRKIDETTVDKTVVDE